MAIQSKPFVRISSHGVVLLEAFMEYDDTDFCEWTPKSGSSILASPAIAENGVVVVGSLQGILTAVGDATWGP